MIPDAFQAEDQTPSWVIEINANARALAFHFATFSQVLPFAAKFHYDRYYALKRKHPCNMLRA